MPVSNGYKKFYRQHIKPEPDFALNRFAKRPIIELPFAFGPVDDLEAVLCDMLINEATADADLLASALCNADSLPAVWADGELISSVTEVEISDAVIYCRIENGEYDDEEWDVDDFVPPYDRVLSWFFEMATYMSLGGRVRDVSIENHASIREYREMVVSTARNMYHNLPETPHPTAKRGDSGTRRAHLNFGTLSTGNLFSS